MLQLQSMVAVPDRVDRYEPTYQQPLQPLMQTPTSYSYPNATPITPVSAGYNLTTAQRRYEYAYPNSAPTTVVPPSPPGDDAHKLSLPSISKLLEISDGKPTDLQQAQQMQLSQSQQSAAQNSTPVVGQSADYAADLQPAFHSNVVGGRLSLPSTPPLVPDGPMEGNQSPSTVSSQSTVQAQQTYYLGQPVTVEQQQQHQRGSFSAESHIPKRLSLTAQPTVAPYPTPGYTPTSQYTPTPTSQYSSSSQYTPTSQYAPSTFVPSPTGMAGAQYYPDSHVLPSSALYNQRPLPSNFPPPVAFPLAGPPPPQSAAAHAAAAAAGNPWQHHHYIGAASQSSFPQSQDRYVCATCQKAFSRPSSLRIHTHSHTGEKPFKCSHAGCGKAFSVRSNMKRHERGCHAAAASIPGGGSAA